MLNLSNPADRSEQAGGLEFVSETTSGHRQSASLDPSAGGIASGQRDLESSTGLHSITPAFLKTSSQPVTCLFHLLFKLLALLTFIFGSFVFGGWEGDYVFTFVTTTILLSVDFWVVKNVSGRILVGMRWWNNISEDGSSSWVFESNTDEKTINTTDKTVFWSVLYVWASMWSILLILNVIRLKIEWVLLVGIGVSLSFANLVGYWKCSKDSSHRMKEWASNQAMRRIFG